MLVTAASEFARVTNPPRPAFVPNAIAGAVTRLEFARRQLHGASVVPGGRSLISPDISLQGALSWIQQARSGRIA